jgi:S-formylglutathione hydrolase FrmB
VKTGPVEVMLLDIVRDRLRVLTRTSLLHVLTFAACLAACATTAPQAPAAAPTHGLLVHEWVHGKGIEGNRLGDSPDRSVHIYLPPSYFTHPERRYPTVYLLHGFGSTSDGDVSWSAPGPDRGGPSVAEAMDAGIASGDLREMIVVMPDCTNAYGGSFYVNSSVTGAWEDFVVRDLVAFVDAKLRTVRGAPARAIVGHSMGGFGALRLGFAHSDVFGVVYAVSPCCIDDMLLQMVRPETFVDALTATTADELSRRRFSQRAAIGAGAAFTPNLEAKPLLVDSPFVAGPSGPQPVEAVQRVWSSMLATSSIASQRGAILRLRAIGLDVGDQDEVKSILPTTQAMDRALTAAGIVHELSVFHGGHVDRLGEQIAKAALPFASKHLGVAGAPSGP